MLDPRVSCVAAIQITDDASPIVFDDVPPILPRFEAL